MHIILNNELSDTITIGDLGLELPQGENVNIVEVFSRDSVLNSTDLESAWLNSEISFLLEGGQATLQQVRDALMGITRSQHAELNTLSHDVVGDSFFIVEKNAEDEVTKIIYYSDASYTIKIRDEEIVRDINGDVYQIIRKAYDSSGLILEHEVQTIHRNIEGSVEYIETVNY